MASKPDTPFWLDAVQKFERAIGEPLEAFVRSDAYFDLMTQANRARARFTRLYERAGEEWLHFFNMPAASDIRRLREQLSRVERQLNQVAKEVADLEEERAEAAKPPRPRPRTKRTRPPAKRKRAPATPKSDGSGTEAESSGEPGE